MAPGKAPRALIPISLSDINKRNTLNYQFSMINAFVETKPSNFHRHALSVVSLSAFEYSYRTRILKNRIPSFETYVMNIHRIVGKHH